MSEVIAENIVVRQMNQVPADSGVRAESPLYHADLNAIAEQGNPTAGVTLQEVALLDHLVIRGDAADASLQAGLQSVTGLTLPSNLQSAENDGVVIRWISPDEWLVTTAHGAGFELEQKLRGTIDSPIAIVNVSGGQTLLNISGADAEEMLRKTTPYDIHISNMPVGKVVTSLFGKAQAVIRRTGEQQFEVIIRRSFADYCWLWLQDACGEFGFTVKA